MLNQSLFHKTFHGWMILSIFLLGLPVLFLTQALAASNTPGDLDPTFVGFTDDGVLHPVGLTEVDDVVVQPDGKIVAVGYAGTINKLAVYRYLPDGQPDSTFNGNGTVIITNMFHAYAVALQSDGKIVVGGTRDDHFQLARLTSEGALDPSFDQDGWVQDLDPQLRFLNAILVQPDNKIVACGGALVGDDFDFAVTRYDTNGARDNTFSDDGKITIGFGEHDFCYNIAQQSDGKLVVVGDKDPGAGFGDDDFTVARLTPTGALDNTFSDDGKLITGFGGDEYARSVGIQPDGKIVVHGVDDNSDATYLARYLPTGVLDATFDGDGKLTIPVDKYWEMTLQSDGKPLLLGYHQSPDGDHKLALRRLNADGTPDTSFNNGGVAWFDFGGVDVGFAVTLQPDGRIVVGGKGGDGSLLIRLWPDGTFDTGGQQTHGLAFAPAYKPGYRESVNAMALQPDGAFLVAGQLYPADYAFSDAFVTRFTPEGFPDPSFGKHGSVNLVGPGVFNAAGAVAVQPDGKIVIAGFSAFDTNYTIMDFLIVRFLPDGTKDPNFGFNGSYLADFANGADGATALALTPDGKIVVVGNVWNGSSYVGGVIRLTAAGMPDPAFGTDGIAYVNLNVANSVSDVVVQPDGKIIIGGNSNKDFFVQRLLENGAPDPTYGINGGYNITDMGGTDSIMALALAPNGWLYAAGNRISSSGTPNADMALAQYNADGLLATCPDPADCQNWPTGTFFVDIGINDYAYSLALRNDNQLVAGGCVEQHFAAVQVPTHSEPIPLMFNTDFVGYPDCAKAVQFIGANTLLLAGKQELYPFSSDWNIALARFETTLDETQPTPTPEPSSTPGPSPTPTPSPTPGPTPGGYTIFLPVIQK